MSEQPETSTASNLSNLPSFFASDPREQTFIRFAEGDGRVRPDGKGLSVALNVFNPDGTPDGIQVCSGEVSARNSNELMMPPSHSDVQFGEPGPIPEVPVTTRCKATWTFADGSTISAIGKGTSHIVPLKPTEASLPSGSVARSGVMADKAAMVITQGTRQFEGARGTVSLDSTVFLPDVEKTPFGQPGAPIHQKSIHVFRVFKGENVEA